MRRLRGILSRFAGLFRRKRLEAEMNEELLGHLEALIERNVAAGMSPHDARNASLRAFGGVTQVQESARDERRSAWGESVQQDLRYAVRQLRKAPGFTIVAVLSLAIGIGATTAIFGFIDAALLKPLPVAAPSELVQFEWVPGPHNGQPVRATWGDTDLTETDAATGRSTNRLFSLRAFERFRDENVTLAATFAVAPLWLVYIEIDGRAEFVECGQLVSGNYYSALGVHASLGRLLQPDDDRADAPPVVVISHRYWQTRFGGAPGVIGKTISVNRTPATIVGVAARGFNGTLLSAGPLDVTLPLAMAVTVHEAGMKTTRPQDAWMRIVGRLKPGVTREQARANLEPVFRAVAREALPKNPDHDQPQLRATPGGWGRSESARREDAELLGLTMGLVGLLLLAACANVANLLLARGATRRREIAMRLALGASRRRLVEQLLIESLLLASLGALLGVVMAAGGGTVLLFEQLFTADWRVLAFASAVAGIVSVTLGLVPALRATRMDLATEFQGGPRTWGGGAGSRLSRGLIVVQVAISLVLLVGAGLFARTLWNLRAVEVGFNRTHLLLFSFDPGVAGHPPSKAADVHRRMVERLGGLPGVRRVSFSAWALLHNSSGFVGAFQVPGRPPPAQGRDVVTWNRVAEDFFETLEMPLLAGRSLGALDHAPTARAIVVNQTLAQTYFPDRGAVGESVRFNGAEREIVGVVADAKQTDLRGKTPPTLFQPFAQGGSGGVHYVVRAAGDPAALAEAVRRTAAEIDPRAPLLDLRTQDQRIDNLLSSERMFARLAAFFGVVALGLACIGQYGLISFSVQRRTGEIGVRMALGALPAAILRMFLRESIALLLLGCVLGIAGALAATRLVAQRLHGISPTDAATYLVMATAMLLMGAIATLLPARRAARVDPATALRTE